MVNILRQLGFIEYKQEYFDSCVVCSKKLTGRQIKFCCNKCGALYAQSPKSYRNSEDKTERISKIEFQKRSVKEIRDNHAVACYTAGRLNKEPRDKKCELCRNKPYYQMHHEDYNKPELVLYLCEDCNSFAHKYINLCKKKGLR